MRLTAWKTMALSAVCVTYLAACGQPAADAPEEPASAEAQEEVAAPDVETTPAILPSIALTVTAGANPSVPCTLSNTSMIEIDVAQEVVWTGTSENGEPAVVRIHQIAGNGKLTPNDPQGAGSANGEGKDPGLYCYMIQLFETGSPGRKLCNLDPEICVRNASGCPGLVSAMGDDVMASAKCPNMSQAEFDATYREPEEASEGESEAAPEG